MMDVCLVRQIADLVSSFINALLVVPLVDYYYTLSEKKRSEAERSGVRLPQGYCPQARVKKGNV
jgi:hypothetical protein